MSQVQTSDTAEKPFLTGTIIIPIDMHAVLVKKYGPGYDINSIVVMLLERECERVRQEQIEERAALPRGT